MITYFQPMYIYFIYSAISKSNCLKRTETSAVLIVFDGVLCEVRACTITVSYRLSTWIRYHNQRLSRACIVHLVIKRTNWSYVKTMSCSGSQLGIPINIKNTKFVKDLPMIDAQLRFNQCNSFREEHISVFSPYGPVLIL